jgi:VanZ family protein
MEREDDELEYAEELDDRTSAKVRTVWHVIAWAATLAVLRACLAPASELPESTVVGQDKLLHVLGFFFLAYAWRQTEMRTKAVLLLCTLLAVGTEVGQHLLANGRSADAWDVAADLVGTLAGLFVVARWPRPRSNP